MCVCVYVCMVCVYVYMYTHTQNSVLDNGAVLSLRGNREIHFVIVFVIGAHARVAGQWGCAVVGGQPRGRAWHIFSTVFYIVTLCRQYARALVGNLVVRKTLATH
jgi:hypothetical protein